VRRDPFGELKAGHLLVEKQLLALHLPSTNPRPDWSRLLQQPRSV
jgi:hypothetical protein